MKALDAGRPRLPFCFGLSLLAAGAFGACARNAPRTEEASSAIAEQAATRPAGSAPGAVEAAAHPSAEPPPRDGSRDPFAQELVAAIKDYRQWQRVDEHPGSAPDMCLSWPPHPSEIRRSTAAEEAGSHGRKLYYLYTSDRSSYPSAPVVGAALPAPAGTKTPIPVGFTIVKESYQSLPLDEGTAALLQKDPQLRLDEAGKLYVFDTVPRRMDATKAARYGLTPDQLSNHPEQELGSKLPPAARGTERQPSSVSPGPMSWGMARPWAPPIRALFTKEGWVRTGERKDLFVMRKVGGEGAPGTDRGWVYGVVSSEGDEVRQSGKLQHCAGCHEKAPHDRLFAPVQTQRVRDP